MKLSISVPDDLWASVHTDTSQGPSDTVQRALRVLADQHRAAQRPLAHAPDQNDLDRYRPAFEKAVEAAETAFREMLNSGYQFGLLVAGGLTGSDFAVLDNPAVVAEIQAIILAWGFEAETENLSFEFCSFVGTTLSAWSDDESELQGTIQDLLGDDDGAPGVQWQDGESEDGTAAVFPAVNRTFADGIVRALRDVRDEAARRLTGTSIEATDR